MEFARPGHTRYIYIYMIPARGPQTVFGETPCFDHICIARYACLFLGHRRPQEATGVHRRPQESTGGHRRPQEATGGHRRPQEATGSHRRPQEATGGHRRPQEATGLPRRPREASCVILLRVFESRIWKEVFYYVFLILQFENINCAKCFWWSNFKTSVLPCALVLENQIWKQYEQHNVFASFMFRAPRFLWTPCVFQCFSLSEAPRAHVGEANSGIQGQFY